MLRFDQVNNAQDLDEAVGLYRVSLQTSEPSDDAYYEIEVNFVWSLLVRFGYTGDFVNLVDAMTIHQETLSHCGVYEATYIPLKGTKDFATCIRSRLGRLHSTKTIEEAIEVCCEAVILCSPGHPNRPRAQGGAYETFDTGVKTHEELMKWSEELRDNAEDSHFILSAFLASGAKGPTLAGSGEFLFILAQLYLIQHDLNLAFSIYGAMQGGTVTQNFRTALMWARLAREHKHPSASQAYSRALQLSEQCIVMRPTVDSQYMLLTSDASRELSSLAASSAIDGGDLEIAVEMLERGRGQLWSILRRYRHSNDGPDPESQSRLQGVAGIATATGQSESHRSLDVADASLETEDSRAFMANIYSELENITTSTVDETYGPISTANVNSRFTRDSAPHRQLLNTLREMDASLSSQPGKQGLSHTFYTSPFDTLRGAAIGGPVIIISTSRYRSDALILREAGKPILVPLDKALEDVVSKLCASLLKIRNVRHDEVVETPASREARVVSIGALSMVDILRKLWEKICAPIVLALERIQTEKHSRIWWCPTGALMQLPLHAAGPYEEGKENLCDLFVSSYTPTLSSLIQARKTMNPKASTPTRLLAIGQSHALPKVSARFYNVTEYIAILIPSLQVHEEFTVLRELFSNHVNIYDNADATPICILSELKKHNWVHFACHGGLDTERPFESYFKLHVGNLSLRQIMRAKLPDAEFAFLAACHTTRVDVGGNPDESLSLAAAIQFCGFRSIVGTLWTMSDDDGPVLARDFYSYMLRNGPQHVDIRDSAVALHKAVEAMRQRGAPAERWTTFVHVGI